MKNTRRIAALVLSLVMLIALVGCGKAEPNTSSNKPPVTEQQPTSAPTVEPTAPPETTEAAPEVKCPYAGEYDVALVNPEGDTIYLQDFVVKDDGTLVGVGDASGMSNFEGTVNEDGTFTGEFTRLGGTLQGTIDAEGNVIGTGEIRGRNYTFEGTKL